MTAASGSKNTRRNSGTGTRPRKVPQDGTDDHVLDHDVEPGAEEDICYCQSPEYRSASCRSASAPASGRISTRPLTIIARMASPGTQTACWNRSASNLATVDLPAADTPEITSSATPPIVSSAHAHVV